ncbi:MAG: SUMF1/EgtB/PvdO family nonheme iron enzyme [Verrucomicrobiota bacterium]
MASFLALSGSAQTAPFPLLIGTNSIYFSAREITNSGALFFYQAADLASLSTNPALFFQTNTPLAGDLSLPVGPGAGGPAQDFFFAAAFPGRLAGQFGDAECVPPPSPPGMALFVSGLSAVLATSQVYTVDFFVTDPAGNLLTNLAGPVQILVLRASDGTVDPDVALSPTNVVVLTDGQAQAQFSIQSLSSLAGDTVGIGPVDGGPAIGELLPELASLSYPTTALVLSNALEGLRGIDPITSWRCPIPSNYQIAGTFGEWRGTGNWDVHEGLDLAAAASNSVVASRGGVVSASGVQPGEGAWVVLDHGDGWFSRYLHLDSNSVAVLPGQVVTNGAVLAANLYAAVGWQSELHFEIRTNPSAQWGVPLPGIAQDPLQTPGIFAPPAETGSPQLVGFGVSHQPPGQYPFLKSPPNPNLSGGLLYLFTQFVDDETNLSGSDYPLGLRSMTFQAAGMPQPVTIQPSNDVEISVLRIPGATNLGFAMYGPLDAANPDRQDWYRYWWAWDTSSCATNPVGPQSLVFTGQSYDGATVTNSLSFGPEVQNAWIPLGSNTFDATIVAHLGAAGNGTSLSQPDQYQLQVLNADGTPVPGVVWDGAQQGNLTSVFETNLDSEVFTFHLPPGSDVTNMTLSVSSLMSTNLRHEVSWAPEMVEIPAGRFVMGSPSSEEGRNYDEGPQTTVTFTYSFQISKYLVTQDQYLAVTGQNPSYFDYIPNNQTCPVEYVAWTDATNFCALLTAIEQSAGRLAANWSYRLPTEAEWEYACRAGTTTPFCYGSNLLSGMANFFGFYEYEASAPWPGTVYDPNGIWLYETCPVGAYAPNAWGLYDTVGNVAEWCQDWFANSLPGGSVTNWQGPPASDPRDPYRIKRGGSWGSPAADCRSASRGQDYPDEYDNTTGFRVVLAPNNP